ncbi:LolA family protein [Ramlibacter sp. MMS24-I3-19]|uniref:LolA family protein n=1 Tax=Ramlibacter sp. MMS24-I3-19 TaxID=3416606 RepID=UPI003D032151
MLRLFAAASALVTMVCAAGAQDLQLPDLMRLLALQKSGKATFVERKYISLLDKPVVSSGELSFTAPDRLEKRTLSPKPESLVLEGDRLSIDANGKKVNINLLSHPEAAPFVESIRGTLAGDLGALERYYSLQLSGPAERWTLQLVPVQPEMLRIVSRIRFEGNQSAVNLIVFEQADGDRSEMRITQVPAR